MNPDLFLHLSASCRVTKGYNRSLIIDFRQNEYWFIPNEWESVLNNKKKLRISEVYNKLLFFHDQISINSFLKFMIENKLIYTTEEGLVPPSISAVNTLDSKSTVRIISINQKHETPLISPQTIAQLHCNCILIRCNADFDLLKLIQFYSKSKLKRIELIIDLKKMKSPPPIKTLLGLNIDITTINFLNSNSNKSLQFNGSTVFYRKDNFVSSNRKLNIDLSLAIESAENHTFYNKRVHIDTNGNIKNAKHTLPHFGNIHEDELADIIAKPDFQQLWKTKKTAMDDCSVCEFRIICIDKRVPLKRKDDTKYTLEECDYNPFINKERGERHYQPLQGSGIESKATGFNINMDLFIEIKSKIWGEF